MIIGVHGGTELWEAIGAVQVIQALARSEPHTTAISNYGSYSTVIYDLAGIPIYYRYPDRQLEFNTVYRKFINGTQNLSYAEMLAAESGFTNLAIDVPRFPSISASEEGGIVLTPFSIDNAISMPLTVWRTLTRMLRLYDLPVTLMGHSHQRMDAAAFTESEILIDLSLEEKLRAIASARLLVGLPNEWMLIASAWYKNLVLLYPDDAPQRKWFPFASNHFGRILYPAHQIQIPAILGGVRQMIDRL